MKNLVKRLTAALLLVCIAVSFVVPATFADTPASNATIYDFDLANSIDEKIGAYAWDGVKLNKAPARADGTANAKTGWKLLDELYADPSCSLNWKGEAYSTSAEQSKIVKDEGGLFTYVATNQTEGYLVLRLAAPAAGAGLYNVSLTSTDARNTIDVYLLDAADYTTPAAAMAAENKIFTGLITNATHETAAPVTVSGGEMILVIHTTNIVAKTRHIISNVTLTPVTGGSEPTVTTEATETTVTTAPAETTTAPVETTEETTTAVGSDKLYTDGVYNIELYQYDRYAPMFGTREEFALSRGSEGVLAGVYDQNSKGYEILAADYPSVLNWKIEAIDSTMTYANLNLYVANDTGMRIQKPATDTAEAGWIALRLNVPQAGTYDVGIWVEGSAHTHNSVTYVFPAEAGTMSEAAIEEKLTDENKIGSTSATIKEPITLTYNNVEIASAGEYILVMKMPENTGKTTIWLSQMTLTPATGGENPTVPEETTQPTEPEALIPGGAVKENFFDIELYRYEAFQNLAGSDVGYTKDYNATDSVQEYLAKSYPSNVNWKIEGFTENSVLYFRGKAKQGLRAEVGAGNYLALRLNVTKAATYHIAISSCYNAYPYTATAYLLPAPENTLTPEQIQAAITDANKLGDYAITTDNLNCAFLDQKIDKAGEYVLIFVAGERDRIYLSSIDFREVGVEAPKEEKDKVLYDFNLYGLGEGIPQRGLNNWLDENKSMKISQKVEMLYDAGKLQWKYEGRSETAIVEAIREKYLRFKATKDMIEVDNAWNAFRLKAPGTGTYDVRLTGVEKNTAVVNLYLIPAVTGVSMTPEQIKAGMTKENLLIAKARISGEDTFYLGEYTFGAEQEYVLVLEFVRGTRLNLVSMEMTRDGLVADGQLPVGKTYSGVVYDLDLADSFDGIFYGKSRFDLPDVYSRVQSRWPDSANWKFEAFSDEFLGVTTADGEMPSNQTRFYNNTGMRLYGEKDSWVALRIKSPGSGTFTVTLNHAVCPNSGTLAMYILPGDTPADKIWDTTDPANRVGKVVLTNATGAVGVEDGYTSFVGYFDFEAGEEYILVLECYENSMYASTLCYMHLSQIIMQKGIFENDAADDKTVKPIAVASDTIKVADPGANSAVCQVNGHDYYFINLEGGTLLVYDLDTAELVDTQDIGVGYGRYMAVAPDGKVWIVGDLKQLVCYDPYTMTVEKSPNIQSALGYKIINVRSICFDENGIAYFTMNTCNLIRYDPATKVFTDLGQLVEGCTYSSGILYHKGYLYVPYYAPGVSSHIVKYNIATGQVEGMTDIYEQVVRNDVDIVGLGIVGDNILLCGSNYATETALAIDINTMEQIEVDLPGGLNLGVSEEIDGKHYVVPHEYGLYEYDVATGVFSKSLGFGNGGIGFRTAGQHGGSTLVTIDGERCLITYTAAGAHPRLYNLDKKEYQHWDNLVYGVGGGSDINSMTVGPEGSNEIYAGTWNTEYCFIYDIDENAVTLQYETVGQTDSMVWYEGKHYAGNYSSTTLNELYPQTLEIIQRFKLDHELTGQLRPLTMEAGGGYIFVGTIPNSNYNGGAVTSYNTTTGQWHCQRNIVPDQSIIGIAYHDGLVFCASSRSGGLGAEAMGESAMIAVYDYEKHEVLALMDPRDHISGLATPVEYIYGLAADPKAEENGRIWGIASDTLFCFTYDKETKTFDVQEVLSFNKTDHKSGAGYGWRSVTMRFDVERGRIYATFANGGGFRCVELADWDAPVGSIKVAETERLIGYIPTHFVLGEDGNLYFANGSDLMLLPLNVTDEDWAISEKVDELIEAVGEEVTLESEAAIKTARSAYDNLTWYYKALTQNLEKLQEAEVDLLECKIAVWEGKEVTADDVPALQELMDVYKPLNARQKRYVKNYDLLKASYDQASDLNDQRIAAAMQKRDNALKELFPITLEEEPEVVAVRTDFEALTGTQQLLVDTAILKEAEAQVAVLRAEFVKEVEVLIQAIPAEITLAAEPAIMAAREGVDKLYALEIKQVSYSKLETAEAKLRNLKNAKAAANEVDALIKAIGIVTLGDAEQIANARVAYNRLNETGRAFCTKAGKLQRAEFILKALQTWGIPAITVVNAGIAFAVIWFVPSLHSKVFKTKKKDEEVIDN